MKKSTAAAAAGAVALTATGAVSALFLTLGQAATPAASDPIDPGTTVITEYVDQNGNPVAPPGDTAALELPRFVVVEAPAPTAEIVEQVEYVTTYAPAAPSAPAYEAGEYEGYDDEEEYEDEEYEEYEEDDDDDEDEDDD